MPTLSTLLVTRNNNIATAAVNSLVPPIVNCCIAGCTPGVVNSSLATFGRGCEELRNGDVFYRTFSNEYDVYGYGSSFCWNAPGSGTAVIELWGAGGTPGTMCCCYGGGLPGNAPAYSRRTVTVTSSSYVCGFLGCGPQSQSLCWQGCSGCSVACLFNITTGAECVMRSMGGAGGYLYCGTSTNPFCCLAYSLSFCACDLSGGGGCGIICNYGGPNSILPACACGGDTNVNGGISCTIFTDCCGSYYPGSQKYVVAIPAGIYSRTGGTRVIVHGEANCSAFSGGNQTNNSRGQYQMALAGMGKGTFPLYSCWTSAQNCSCYPYEGCIAVAPTLPGTPAWVCGGMQSYSVRGGGGAVKITFYS